MQLIASRTAQEYNWRKNRKGAFWEDRYHATAIEQDGHLFRCVVYLDMNMVRAGVVNHPSDWEFSGYNEIQNPRQRYAFINYKRLMQLLNLQTIDELRESHSGWIDEALKGENRRESKWVQSVAVGSKEFTEKTKVILGFQVKGRSIKQSGEDYQLREPQAAYSPHFAPENAPLSNDNTCCWPMSLSPSLPMRCRCIGKRRYLTEWEWIYPGRRCPTGSSLLPRPAGRCFC